MQKPDLIPLKKALTELNKLLKPVYKKINDFNALNYRTPDEEKELEKLLMIVKDSVPIYASTADIFLNEAYMSAVAYYNELKQLAGKGNQTAMNVIKELAPLYEQTLLSEIDKN